MSQVRSALHKSGIRQLADGNETCQRGSAPHARTPAVSIEHHPYGLRRPTEPETEIDATQHQYLPVATSTFEAVVAQRVNHTDRCDVHHR